MQALLAAGVLVEQGKGRSHGGRRPRLLTVNPDFGHVWTIDIGPRHVRLTPMDMTGAGDLITCYRKAPHTDAWDTRERAASTPSSTRPVSTRSWSS